MDAVDEALVEHELSTCPPDQLAWMWRGLCARMLHQALLCRGRLLDSQDDAANVMASRRWLSGGGIVTFEEACETTGISPEKSGRCGMTENAPCLP